MTEQVKEETAPAEAKPEVKRQPELKDEATITWLETDQFTRETQTCLRGYPDVIRAIVETLKEKPHFTDRPITVTVDSVDPANPVCDKEGKPFIYHLASGPAKEMVMMLAGKSLHPMVASREFQRLASFVSERSDMKGVLITFVFGDAVAGGFGLVSTITEVTDDDILALGEAASNQAQMFKDEMKTKRRHLKFPGDKDKSALILPSRFTQ